MMPTPPDPPLREATPEQRRRSVRMFWLILLLFPTVILTMVAYLSVKGRQVRDYGHAVYVEAQKRTWTASGTVTEPCSSFAAGAVPGQVQSCEVEVTDGTPVVVLKIEGDRQYRVDR